MINIFNKDYNHNFLTSLIFNDNLGDHDTYNFFVYHDYTGLPVMHIVSTFQYTDIALGIFEPIYYQHRMYKDIFIHPEEIDRALRQKEYTIYENGIPKTISYWEAIKNNWKTDQYYCASRKIKQLCDTILEQPDYSNLDYHNIKKRTIGQALISKIIA